MTRTFPREPASDCSASSAARMLTSENSARRSSWGSALDGRTSTISDSAAPMNAASASSPEGNQRSVCGSASAGAPKTAP